MKQKTLLLFLLPLFILHGQNLPPIFQNNQVAQIDSRIRAYLSPTRIVWKYDGDGKLVSGKENLLKQGNGQSDLFNRNICTLKSTENQFPSLLLDFGKEIHGGLQFVTGMFPDHKPIRIRVRLGESVSEAMSNINEKGSATNDHAMRDFILELPWLGVAEIGNSGFRFARIDLIDPNRELQLKEVRAIFSYRDIPYLGSFKCDDERLNQIWETGAYTVHLNMQEYLWDGIKRDRLVWVGDMHPEVSTINTVFGFNEVVPKSLDLIRDITPLPQWMNGIGTYSIWWLIIHHDWYMQHGNLSYLKEQHDYIARLCRLLITKIQPDGNVDYGAKGFLDWPSSSNQVGVEAGVHALTIWAMQAGKEIAGWLEDPLLKQECDTAEKLLRTYTPSHNDSKQGAALMSLIGQINAEQTDKEVLSIGGAKNFSTFYGFYMLEAMAKAKNYDTAIDVIKTYWGAMLDLGATTFWEDFNMEWIPNAARIDELLPQGKKDIHGDYGDYCYKGFRHSLCHGWASGPTTWLSRHVLGIEVLEPGCKSVRIIPSLGPLQWAEGTYPTPMGIIKVRHDKQSDGSVRSKIEAPKGVKIIRK